MKVNYTTSNKRISVEFEGDSQRDIFEQISKFQEVFEQSVCINVAMRIYASWLERLMITNTTS